MRVFAPDADPELGGVAVAHPFRDPRLDGPAAPANLPTRIRNYLRDWAYWPDPDVRWTRQLIKAALAYNGPAPDWILTTSPPESVHLAGARLKRALGARWAADFRDHWFERAFRLNRRGGLRRKLEQAYARRLMRTVDAVTGVNAAILAEAACLAPHVPPGRRAAIGHFAVPASDPERFDGPGPHLLHSGSFSLSDPDCNIGPLLTAFERARASNGALQLHLAGRLSSQEIECVSASAARNDIHLHGVLSLQRTHALQAGADGLVAVAAPNAPVPPGKLSEYYSARRPIIAIGSPVWTEPAGLGDGSVDAAARSMVSIAQRPPPSWPDGLISSDDAAQALLTALRR